MHIFSGEIRKGDSNLGRQKKLYNGDTLPRRRLLSPEEDTGENHAKEKLDKGSPENGVHHAYRKRGGGAEGGFLRKVVVTN